MVATLTSASRIAHRTFPYKVTIFQPFVFPTKTKQCHKNIFHLGYSMLQSTLFYVGF
jgi:hypothetical protein